MSWSGNKGRLCWFWADRSFWSKSFWSRQKSAAWVSQTALFFGLLLLPGCMAPSAAISEPRFREAASADFIVRYYSDSVSHVLKPLTTEGEFLVACDRPFLLNLAGQQPRRQLAVIVLIHYFNTADESKAKAAWSEDLKRLDYRRVVFLLAGRGKQIDGLPILGDSEIPATVAKK
ncbi:MAG: hypothetical protein WCT12_25945 [Verrucomicrobiota bacterium]